MHILSFYLINLTYLSWSFCRWVYHCRKFWTTHFVVWNRICLWAWLDGYWSAGETRSLAGCWWSLPWTKEVCLEDSEESSKFKREQWSLFKFLQMHKWPTFWWSPWQRRSSNHWESISVWWRTGSCKEGVLIYSFTWLLQPCSPFIFKRLCCWLLAIARERMHQWERISWGRFTSKPNFHLFCHLDLESRLVAQKSIVL